MSRKSMEDLKQFSVWLKNERSLQDRTVTAYVSLVRSITKKIGQFPSNEDVLAFFMQLTGERAEANARCVWGVYCDFVLSEHKTKLQPAPLHPKDSRGSLANDLPTDVLSALYYCKIKNGLQWSDLSRIPWGNVLRTRVKNHFTARVTGCSRTYTLHDRCIEIFRSYAQPNNAHAPLIPYVATSNFPYPVAQLAKQVNTFEKKYLKSQITGEPLGCFDPWVEILHEDQDIRIPTPKVKEEDPDVAKPTPPIEELDPNHTTTKLLASLSSQPRKPVKVDGATFERRSFEGDGEWRNED